MSASRTRTARIIAITSAMMLATIPLAAQRPDPSRGRSGAATDVRWPVKSREHVDLWLHAFALISNDSSPVPLFRRGYRESITVEKNKASVFTELDANRDVLAKRLHDNPALVNAQFLALYFGSWPELEGALDLFVRSEGNPRAATNEQTAGTIAFLAGVFPSKDDRDFARRLLVGLRSEREKFYHAWWLAETRRRDRVFEVVDSLWQHGQRAPLQSFLSHVQLGNGELILVLALEGEGRTIAENKQTNRIAVGFPDSLARAGDVLFTFAHEAVSSLTATAVDDNTTPAEKRAGAATRLQNAANVRGGALLLAHVSPELAKGYAAFYLRAAGVAAGDDVMATFARTFALPQGMLDSIERQIAVAFGGI